MEDLMDRIEKKVKNEIERFLAKDELDLGELKCLVHIWKDLSEVE